jgi:hypothetical protein
VSAPNIQKPSKSYDREPVFVTPSIDQVEQFVARSNRLLLRAIREAYKDVAE